MAVTAIIGAIVTAYVAYEASQAQAAQAEYQQKVAKNEATARRDAASIEAENLRDRQRAVMAAQRAGIGASGVLPSEGTPLLVQTDSAEKAALNEARVRYSGEVGARFAESEAILEGYKARTARRMGYINAGASLLRGAGSAASSYRGGDSGGDAGYSTSAGYQSQRRGERQTY